MSEPNDPVSRGATQATSGAKTGVVELSTDQVHPDQRLEFWRDTVLRRMVPVKLADSATPFSGRLRRISGDGAELIDHATDAMWADRTEQRCAADGCGDISIDLMLQCDDAAMEHGGERRVRPGDLMIIDYSRPVRVKRSRHRSLAFMLNRSTVTEVLGSDLSALAGLQLPNRGLGAVLRSHLRSIANEAMHLDTAARRVAVDAAVSLALAALQTTRHAIVDTDRFAEGWYAAARDVIARRFADPELTPIRVAELVGCARASLYRLFARNGESVAAVIWRTRLERARDLLEQPAMRDLSIGDIALRCGFLEASSFSRMFKHHYGISPRDARHDAVVDRSRD